MSGTLYVTDLDGTLLGSDSRVSPESARIIRRLTRQGVMFTAATARTPATVVPLFGDFCPGIPAVVMTGAALWDFKTGRYLHPRLIPRADVEPIIDGCRRRRVNPFIYVMGEDGILDVYISGRLTNIQQKFVADRVKLPLKRFHVNTIPFDMDRDGDRVVLIYAMGEIDHIEALAAQTRANSECAVSAYPDIFNHRQGNLEIFAPGVSKAAGIRRLAAMVGADEVVVFGDNLNDLPMMAVADCSVAVGNAVDAVKEAADITIGPNTADSVARFVLARHKLDI